MDIFFDWEVFSEVDIRDHGAYVYADHESTHPICMAYAKGLDAPIYLWVSGEPCPFTRREMRTATFHAHNAAYERLIMKVMEDRYGWEPVRLEQYSCTAYRCAVLSLPRKLEKAADALGLDVQKDMSGHRAMMKLCKPRKPTKSNPATRHFRTDLFATVHEYCITDVDVEREIYKATLPLTQDAQDLYVLDQRINDRGIPIDANAIRSGISLEEWNLQQELADLRWITHDQVESGRQVAALKDWLEDQGVVLPNLQKKTIENYLDETEDVPEHVHDVLNIRLALSKASVSKLYAMQDRKSQGDRVRGGHLIHGANTGRWAGMGIQPHNFKRGMDSDEEICKVVYDMHMLSPPSFKKKYGEISDKLSNVLRGMIWGGTQDILGVSDFAAIENRVCAWVADHKKLVDQFFDFDNGVGREPYCIMADKIYGYEVNKEDHKEERQLGKTVCLAAQFGMGHKRFKETVKEWTGKEITIDFAKDVIDIWREENSPIKRFWYQIQDAAIECVQSHREIVVDDDLGIFFRMNKRWLQMVLPSGRAISYTDPWIEYEWPPWDSPIQNPVLYYMGVGYNTQWQELKTYGGKLTENLVQGIAADYMTEALFNLDAAGYDICLHVHDEAVVELPGMQMLEREKAAEAIEKVMAKEPWWGVGCPVKANAFCTKRYHK